MTARKATKATAKRTTRKAVTPKPSVPSLMEFAPPRLTVARLEGLPEWPEILTGYHNGVSTANMRRWLIAKGYDGKSLPTAESMSRHLRENHSRG